MVNIYDIPKITCSKQTYGTVFKMFMLQGQGLAV